MISMIIENNTFFQLKNSPHDYLIVHVIPLSISFDIWKRLLQNCKRILKAYFMR